MTGENYRFGYKASGDATELVKLCEEFGLSAFIVRSVMDTAKRSLNGFSGAINSSDKGQVSSSRVRHALAMGDMEYVSELLGRKHRLLLMVNQHCLHEKKSIVLPNSCMLNMPPAEGLYENCDLVNGGYLGPCRVIINSDTIIIEMKDDNSLSLNPIQEVQLGIEFGWSYILFASAILWRLLLKEDIGGNTARGSRRLCSSVQYASSWLSSGAFCSLTRMLYYRKKKVEISPGLPYTQGQWSQTGIFWGLMTSCIYRNKCTEGGLSCNHAFCNLYNCLVFSWYTDR